MSNRKPLIAITRFEDDDKLNGVPSFVKKMLGDFQVTLEMDLKNDPSLCAQIEGIIYMHSGLPSILMDKSTYEKMTNLKVFSSVSAGYNHLDVQYFKSRGIRIGITPGVLNDATAEMAITLMMACARDLRGSMELAMGSKPVTSFGINTHRQEVTGSTLGIVGLGGIGLEVAQRARGLKMNIVYHNRNKRADDNVLGATYYSTLDTMLPHCDFVIISCALNDQSKGLFSTKQFTIMKSTAFIINVARGPVIDSMALVEALKEGQIGGAGLDVTDPEPLPRDHPLLKCPNIIISPHWGSATFKTRMAMYQRATDNMRAVLLGNGDMPSELNI